MDSYRRAGFFEIEIVGVQLIRCSHLLTVYMKVSCKEQYTFFQMNQRQTGDNHVLIALLKEYYSDCVPFPLDLISLSNRNVTMVEIMCSREEQRNRTHTKRFCDIVKGFKSLYCMKSHKCGCVFSVSGSAFI